MYDILCCVNKGCSFSTISLKAKLNNYQAQVYLRLMMDKGFIKREIDSYQKTEKGQKWMQSFAELNSNNSSS